MATSLQVLGRRGLSKGLIDQIAQLGAEDGGAVAANLSKASNAELKKLSSAYTSLNKTSTKGAKGLATTMYQNGVDAAKGLVKGLTSQLDKVNAASEKLAKAVTSTIKKKLKIHSPSREMLTLGRYTGEGFVNGVEDMVRDAARATANLTAVPTRRQMTLPAASTGNRGAAAGYSGAAPQITLNVTAPERTDPWAFAQRLAEQINPNELVGMVRAN